MGDNNANDSQLQPLTRQNSMKNLTLDEIQTQLGLWSMNLDDLLDNVWTDESFGLTNLVSLQCDQSKKENDDNEMKCQEREPTWGEMAFENFLFEEGMISELSSSSRKNNIVPKSNEVVPQTALHNPWIQYQQPLHMEIGATLDVPFTNNQVSPVMETLSNLSKAIRKREEQEEMIEKKLAKKQKRMIRNRECAARMREKKKAYLTELETKVSSLEAENEKLRKLKRFENILSGVSPTPKPIYQIRRATSASF